MYHTALPTQRQQGLKMWAVCTIYCIIKHSSQSILTNNSSQSGSKCSEDCTHISEIMTVVLYFYGYPTYAKLPIP